MIWRRLFCAYRWANENYGFSFNLSILIELNQVPAMCGQHAAWITHYQPVFVWFMELRQFLVAKLSLFIKIFFLGSEGSICCKSQRLFWCAISRLCQQKISRGGFILQHFCCEGIMIDDLAGLYCTFYDYDLGCGGQGPGFKFLRGNFTHVYT